MWNIKMSVSILLNVSSFPCRPASRWRHHSVQAPVPCTCRWPTCRLREQWVEPRPSAHPACRAQPVEGWAPWQTRPAARRQPSWLWGSSWKRRFWRSLHPNHPPRSSTSCRLPPTASSSTWWAWRRWCRVCWTARVSLHILFHHTARRSASPEPKKKKLGKI